MFDTHENDFVIATLVNALHILIARTTEGGGEMVPEAISWSDMDSIIIKSLEFWGPRRGYVYTRQHFTKLMRVAFGCVLPCKQLFSRNHSEILRIKILCISTRDDQIYDLRV